MRGHEEKGRLHAPGESPGKDHVYREFGGMNMNSPRQSIGESEFYWLENLQPIAPGNLRVVDIQSAVLKTIASQTVITVWSVNISGSDYFIVYCISGNVYQVLASTPYTSTLISTGRFTSQRMSVAQWKNSGIVLVDPVDGYWDWRITAPNTLTLIDAATLGNSIATYAGRVWIGLGRTVKFTDVDSYNSFAGAAGAFTITDQTLHQDINQLFTANNFLYIFGDNSIDVLGDVAVSGGVTTFTRTNVTASVGTQIIHSIMPYYRMLLFGYSTGFYSLSGATPQKISTKLDGLLDSLDFTCSAGQVMVNNILCAAFLVVVVNEVITPPPNVSRPLIALLSDGKWWLASQGANLRCIATAYPNGRPKLYGLSNVSGNIELTQIFGSQNHVVRSIMISRLIDGGDPMTDKTVLRAGLGIKNTTTGLVETPTVTLTTDNEFTSQSCAAVPSLLNTGYKFYAAKATTAAGKYFGYTMVSDSGPMSFTLFASKVREDKPW